jgi:thioredoxin 1
MANPNTQTFTDDNFEADVLRSDVPVLVDFSTQWCGGCRQLAPMIDVMANEYADKAKIGKLDVASNVNTARRYGIQRIPTLLLFKGGNVVEQRVGAIGKVELQKMLDPHLQPMETS